MEPKEPRVPRIGDIVMYVVSDFDDDVIRHNHAEELPAIVVAVWEDNCVNLKVFTDGPVDAWATSVEAGDLPGQWYFPSD